MSTEPEASLQPARRKGSFAPALGVSLLLVLAACTTPERPDSITLSQSEVILEVGEELTLTATVLSQTGAKLDRPVEWNSDDEAIVTVEDGVVTGAGPGTASITARFGGMAETALVKVAEPVDLVTGLVIDPGAVTLILAGGDAASTLLTVLLTHESGTRSEPESVLWTSGDDQVASVDGTGLVTAQAVGTTQVTAQSGDFNAAAAITVTDSITGLVLDTDALTIVLSGVAQAAHALSASFTLASGGTAPATGVTWSSDDENAATVDAAGFVTGVDKGSAVVSAEAAGHTATAIVTVQDSVIGLRLQPKQVPELSLSNPRETADLTAWYVWASPTTDDTPAVDVTWHSSNRTIAVVNHNGRVAPVGAGTATVTASSAGHNLKASTTVSVDDPLVALILESTSQSFVNTGPNEYAIGLTVADPEAVQAVITLTQQRASGTTVSIPVSAATITADPTDYSHAISADLETLTLTGIGAGDVTFVIAVSTGSTTFSANLTVTVRDPIVELAIAPESVTLEWDGTTEQSFSASYVLASGNTVPASDVQWDVNSAPSAVISSDGLLELAGAGTATTETGTVTATGTNLAATASITVLNPATAIGIFEDETQLQPGDCSLELAFNESAVLQALMSYASQLQTVPAGTTIWSIDPDANPAITGSTDSGNTVVVAAVANGAAELTVASQALLNTVEICVTAPVVAIATGNAHSVGLLEDGTVYAWGDNQVGQLGTGDDTDGNTPLKIKRSLFGDQDVIAIAAGSQHSLALLEDGTVYTWGDNREGQLGNGEEFDYIYEPQAIKPASFDDGKVTALAAGSVHSLALLEDGTVYAWGLNSSGQLGPVGKDATNRPQKIERDSFGGLHVIAIAAGIYHSLALVEDGTVYAWGSNRYGQRGIGDALEVSTPLKIGRVSFGDLGVIAIAAGFNHSLALGEDGTLYAWGDNGSGQLGTGKDDETDGPQKIVGASFAHSKVEAIAAGYDQSFALLEGGTLYAWGRNHSGQLGNGLIGDSVDEPQPVLMP